MQPSLAPEQFQSVFGIHSILALETLLAVLYDGLLVKCFASSSTGMSCAFCQGMCNLFSHCKGIRIGFTDAIHEHSKCLHRQVMCIVSRSVWQFGITCVFEVDSVRGGGGSRASVYINQRKNVLKLT